MDTLRQFRSTLDKYLGYALVALMGMMVLDVVWGVVARYVMDNPSSFTGELAGYLLIWVGLLGASLASGKGLHLSIDLFPNRLTPSRRRILDIIIQILIFLFGLGVLVIGGIRLVYITLSLGQLSPSLGIPLGYVYLVLPLSGVIIMFYAVADIAETVVSGPVAHKQEPIN